MTPTADHARTGRSRILVRGILVGALCGLAGGTVAIVLWTVLASISSGIAGLSLLFYGVIPAVFVGGVVGAAVGLVGSASAVAGRAAAARLWRGSARASRVAASVGAAVGSAAAIAAGVLLFSPIPGAGWILAPSAGLLAGAVAARIAWRQIDTLAAYRVSSAREARSWRVLLAGFALAVAALVQSMVLLADSYWWSWSGEPDGAGPVAGVIALIVVAPTAAVVLVVGAVLAVHKTSLSAAAAVVMVAVLVLVTLLAVSGLTSRQGRTDDGYVPSIPVEPGGPIENEPPAAEPPAEPVLPDVATTAFTLAEITASSQAQIDATIAAVGPINDPAIPAGSTTFPASIGGCGNLDGGRVNFEVWFLVDDLPGGFDRARELWLSEGFVPDEGSTADRVGVTGAAGAAVNAMTLENKSGTVKFTVQSVCVAGDDY